MYPHLPPIRIECMSQIKTLASCVLEQNTSNGVDSPLIEVNLYLLFSTKEKFWFFFWVKGLLLVSFLGGFSSRMEVVLYNLTWYMPGYSLSF